MVSSPVVLRSDPFRLGVASGYPTASSVVLWTRLAPAPDQPDGGMSPQDVAIEYELALDEQCALVHSRGTIRASALLAHSARVEVQHLEPARDYWYRFTAGAYRSRTGRTRTLPAPDAPVASLHLAVACCQHFEHAHFAPLRHLAAAAPDLVLHLGDYIYEGAPTTGRIRRHTGNLCQSLSDYRLRYAQYQQDPALQDAHAAAPWLCTWDDHEVANDYAGPFTGRDESPAEFDARRRAAYQAYYEHLPLPPSAAPRDGGMTLYARRQVGALATLHVLDQRQYRSAEAGAQPQRAGGNQVHEADHMLRNPAQTMLGAEQEAWLAAGLAATQSRWTLLAQGTLVSYLDEQPDDGRLYDSDHWNGYPEARRRLAQALQQPRVSNPVVLSGDVHAFMACELHTVPEQQDSPRLAPEFVATSIASDSRPQATLDAWRAENANILLAEGRSRGYLSVQLTPQSLRIRMLAALDALNAASNMHLLREYVVESGDPTIHSG